MDPKQLEKDKQCAKKFQASESQNALMYWKIFKSMFRFHNTFKVQTGNEQEAGSYYITGDEWGMKKRPKYEWSAGKQI